MIVYKEPKFENDSYMFVIDLEKDLFAILHNRKYPFDYVIAKYTAFEEKNISKEPFEAFADRPSLREFKTLPDLEGSIYTFTCQSKNKLDYNHIIK